MGAVSVCHWNFCSYTNCICKLSQKQTVTVYKSLQKCVKLKFLQRLLFIFTIRDTEREIHILFTVWLYISLNWAATISWFLVLVLINQSELSEIITNGLIAQNSSSLSSYHTFLTFEWKVFLSLSSLSFRTTWKQPGTCLTLWLCLGASQTSWSQRLRYELQGSWCHHTSPLWVTLYISIRIQCMLTTAVAVTPCDNGKVEADKWFICNSLVMHEYNF